MNIYQRISIFLAATVLFTSFIVMPLTTQLPWVLQVSGLVLALLGLLAWLREGYLRYSVVALFAGLLLGVGVMTYNLWDAVLNEQRIDVSFHLLGLMLNWLLAMMLFFILRLQPSGRERASVSARLNETLQVPPLLLSAVLALILCSVLLAFLYTAGSALMASMASIMLTRGVIPPITMTLFFWGSLLLLGKWYFMWQSLKNGRFDEGLKQAYGAAVESDSTFEQFSQSLWQQFESFYTLPRYINWAIPILGFIGTVLGISMATEQLGAILANSGSDFGQLMGEALTPLGIAFDTTLIALSLSIVLALAQTLLYRWEEMHVLQAEERCKSSLQSANNHLPDGSERQLSAVPEGDKLDGKTKQDHGRVGALPENNRPEGSSVAAEYEPQANVAVEKTPKPADGD